MAARDDAYINKMSFEITLRLKRALDPDDKWKELLAVIQDNPLDGPPLDPDFRGILDNCHQRKESPTERLLSELGHKGYKVMDLKHWLRLAGLQRALDLLEGETNEPHISDLKELDMSPSDVGLQGILELLPVWEKYAIALGLTIAQVEYYQGLPQRTIRGLFALKYWRDGQCGPSYPCTWGFLLDVIKDCLGPNVAEVLRKKVAANKMWTISSPTGTGEGGSPIAESFQMKFIQAAIEESGFVEVEIVKVVTLGPPEAGKTQLKRALTGNMEESTESTPLSTGAEVSMERFFDGGVTWDRLGKAELQAALYNTVDSESYNREDPVLDHPQPENRVHALDDETTSGNVSTNSDREDSGQEDSGNPDSLYQEFGQLREKVLGNFSKSKENRKLDKVRFIHFIDSGGQPAFFDLHPVVATSRAVYLIVYNSAEGLSACPKITYRKPSDFPTKELPNPNQSNLDMMKRSVITLHHCKQKFFEKGEKLQMCLGVESVSNKFLPVKFVGTKKGEWLQDKSGPISKSITSCLSSYPSLTDDLRFNFHFVESLDPSCEGVKKLRKAISDTTYKFKIPFPLKWFYCQLIFWSADNPAFSVLSYANLQELCVQEGFVSNDEMFFALLTTFHMLGIFSCPELDDVNASKEHLHCSPVFTNPDVLYEQVSTILAVPFRDLEAPNQELEGDKIFDFRALQKTGIITRESLSLLKIPDTIGSFTNFHSYLLKYLVKWRLAAEMRIEGSSETGPNEQQLFIPSILPPHEGCNFPLPDCPIPQFALTICDEKSKEYYVPQGLFPHFIVSVMNRSDEGYFVPEGVDNFSPRCCNVIAITKRKRKGTEYPYTVYVADNIDHVAVHIKPSRFDENDPRWTENDCYKIIDDLKNSMEEAYNQLYQKKERSSVILACECSCVLVKKKEEETKETHLGRLDFDEPEDPVIYCLSRRQVDHEMPCTGILRDILCVSGKQDVPGTKRGVASSPLMPPIRRNEGQSAKVDSPHSLEIGRSLPESGGTVVQHVPGASSSVHDDQEHSLMEFNNKAPSDVGLRKVAMRIGSCNLLAVDLGIPLAHITSIPDGPLKELLTLAYWRDGKCDSSLPTTWGFLLKKVEGVSGRNVAEELRGTLSKDPACVQMNPPPQAH